MFHKSVPAHRIQLHRRLCLVTTDDLILGFRIFSVKREKRPREVFRLCLRERKSRHVFKSLKAQLARIERISEATGPFLVLLDSFGDTGADFDALEDSFHFFEAFWVLVLDVGGFSDVFREIVEGDERFRVLAVVFAHDELPVAVSQGVPIAFLDEVGSVLARLAEQGSEDVLTVVSGSCGELDVEQVCEGGHEVEVADHGACRLGLDTVGPTKDHGHAVAAFVDLVLAAAIKAGAVVTAIDFLL